MKKILLMALISLSLTGFAQDDNLPEKVEKAFSLKYPDCTIDNWFTDSGMYYLEYYIKRSNMYTAVFTKDGIWKETSEIISDDDIPDKLKGYIQEQYPDFLIDYSEKVQANNSLFFIRVTLDDEDEFAVVKSDLNGNNIERVK